MAKVKDNYSNEEVAALLSRHRDLWNTAAEALSEFNTARHLVDGNVTLNRRDLSSLSDKYEELDEDLRDYFSSKEVPEHLKKLEREKITPKGLEGIRNNIKRNSPAILKKSRELREFYDNSILQNLGCNFLRHSTGYWESTYSKKEPFNDEDD